VILICDNLNTHSLGAFYEAFPADVARSLARRLEIVPTPKHGSWLNIVENELSALTAQWVKARRFGTIEELRKEVTAWTEQCNKKQKGVHWHFSVENARNKLYSLYPKIKS
jgi:recombinational DNA repair ATPase RecF